MAITTSFLGGLIFLTFIKTVNIKPTAQLTIKWITDKTIAWGGAYMFMKNINDVWLN